MSDDVTANNSIHIVLVNHEEQYSLWNKDHTIPKGWKQVGPEGSKEDCLKYVEEVWTDMRPLSLRKLMDADRAGASDGVH